MAIVQNKAWYDICYISLAQEGGSENQLRAKTSSLQITGGDFDIESIDTFGGAIKRVGRRNDIQISFDAIPVSVSDFDWAFHGQTNSAAASITASAEKDYRLTLLWSSATGITSAAQAMPTHSSNESYRQIYAEANMISLENSQDAGDYLKAKMTFKLCYNDDTGAINWQKAIQDTANSLSAVPAYTTGTKF